MANDEDFSWSLNSKSDDAASNPQNLQFNIFADDDAFIDLP